MWRLIIGNNVTDGKTERLPGPTSQWKQASLKSQSFYADDKQLEAKQSTVLSDVAH